jgi:glycosyltransferase involved in cell wall biosynthesis
VKGAPTAIPTVSVVIPTYRRRERLALLLDALATEAAAEVIVVVNGADDGSMAMLEARAASDPKLRPIQVAAAGQVLALQTGVEAACGEVVLLLDDDVLPEPGLVSRHAERHSAERDLVQLGYMPVAIPRPRRPGQYPVDLYARAYERVCDEYEEDPSAILRGLWAGNVSIRHSDCVRVGLRGGERRSDGYEYHEDRDLGLRCLRAGLHGAFDRRLRARHLYERTPASFLAVSRNSGASRARVHREHPDAIDPIPGDFFERAVPQPGRTLVHLSRRRPLQAPIRGLLRLLIRCAGAIRFFKLESHLGYVLGTIEQQRGAMSAGFGTERDE